MQNGKLKTANIFRTCSYICGVFVTHGGWWFPFMRKVNWLLHTNKRLAPSVRFVRNQHLLLYDYLGSVTESWVTVASEHLSKHIEGAELLTGDSRVFCNRLFPLRSLSLQKTRTTTHNERNTVETYVRHASPVTCCHLWSIVVIYNSCYRGEGRIYRQLL